MTIGKFLIVIGLLFILTPAISQKIDSLKAILPNATGMHRARILNQLAREYLLNDDSAATNYSHEGFRIASEVSDSALIIRTGRVLSTGLRRISLVDSSLKVDLTILPMARKKRDDHELMAIVNSIGLSYTYQGQYDKALHFHLESLLLREQTRDTLSIALALNNVGLVYYKLNDFENAANYFKRSVDYKEQFNSQAGLVGSLTNISLCYKQLGDYKNASFYIEKAVSRCCIDANPDLSNLFYAYGEIYLEQKRYDDAEPYFIDSYKYAVRSGDVRLQFDNIDRLLQIYFEKKKPENFHLWLSRADELVDERSAFPVELMNIYASVIAMYRNENDFEKTAFYQQKYIHLKDSVFNEGLTFQHSGIRSLEFT